MEMVMEDCPICLSEIRDNFTAVCCKKIFCKGCIDRWYNCNSTCPMCRCSSYSNTIAILDYNSTIFDMMLVDIDAAILLLGI